MVLYANEINIRDAFRAQYFFSSIERELDKIELATNKFEAFSTSISEALREFSQCLATELDQLILPTIAFEICKARQEGDLFGNTPTARYESFFVDDSKYTKRAQDVLDNYPFLFELIEHLINQTFNALLISITRYKKNEIAFKRWLQLPTNVKIQQILPLNGADRHSSQQTLLFVFSNGCKVIYKPVDLRPDLLFSHFVKKLELEEPFNLKELDVFPFEEYGWIKFIEKKECETQQQVEDFYRRAGVLLAVADSLNYTDGHCENLIADGPFPILIDGETLFQNYEQPVINDKNILTTFLVQKIDDLSENCFLNSAFQAPNGIKYEYLQTHAIQDRTDEIGIRYHGFNFSPHHHCPFLDNKPCPSHDYVSFVIEGYCHGYKKITTIATAVKKDENWWKAVGEIRGRIVLRETISYAYLIRKMQLPEQLTSRKRAEFVLLEKLGTTPYSQYEADDILSLNIPYFYHIPSERHLYDSRGHKYPNVFAETGITRLKRQFQNRSEEKMSFDCKILSRHLVSPLMNMPDMIPT